MASVQRVGVGGEAEDLAKVFGVDAAALGQAVKAGGQKDASIAQGGAFGQRSKLLALGQAGRVGANARHAGPLGGGGLDLGQGLRALAAEGDE